MKRSTLSLVPSVACAEGMDKEPSLLVVWCGTLIVGVVVFAVARLHPWLLLAILPMAMCYFYAHLSEVRDPFVGPAILQEAGQFYVASSWAGPVIVIGAAIVGWWRRKHGVLPQQGA